MMGEDWIRIQETTFRNWCNEQLKVSGRAVSNLVTDLCDGVCLVALVEALQVGSQLCEDLPPPLCNGLFLSSIWKVPLSVLRVPRMKMMCLAARSW